MANEKRWNGRCVDKRHDFRISVLIPRIPYQAASYCVGVSYPYTAYRDEYDPACQGRHINCPEGHRVRWNKIKGTHNPDVKCNAKCTGAIGHVCECSCGGANHGTDYSEK